MKRNQPPNRLIKFNRGFIQELVVYIKLIIRLMGDRRVNPLVKLIPLGTLLYTLWPIDIPGPIDDAVILGTSMYLFIELCPPEVVEEHRQAILAQAGGIKSPRAPLKPEQFSPDDIIDAEYWEGEAGASKGDESQ